MSTTRSYNYPMKEHLGNSTIQIPYTVLVEIAQLKLKILKKIKQIEFYEVQLDIHDYEEKTRKIPFGKFLFDKLPLKLSFELDSANVAYRQQYRLLRAFSKIPGKTVSLSIRDFDFAFSCNLDPSHYYKIEKEVEEDYEEVLKKLQSKGMNKEKLDKEFQEALDDYGFNGWDEI